MTTKTTSDGSAIVDTNYPWRPIETCSSGHKVQLLGKYGVAYYGNGPDGWAIAWAPCPKVPPEIKERLG